MLSWNGTKTMIKMIADHGFRQVIQSFVEIGYELRMSNFLTKGQKQWCLLNSCLIVFLIDLSHINFFSTRSMLKKSILNFAHS